MGFDAWTTLALEEVVVFSHLILPAVRAYILSSALQILETWAPEYRRSFTCVAKLGSALAREPLESHWNIEIEHRLQLDLQYTAGRQLRSNFE